jgi:hypothetical protein
VIKRLFQTTNLLYPTAPESPVPHRRVRWNTRLGAFLICSSLLAHAAEWTPWQTADDDDQLSVRAKFSSRNPYSGQCDWFIQIRNDHSYKADIHYVGQAQQGIGSYDHTSYGQAPGSVVAVVLTISNCDTIYLAAKGTPSH